MKLINVALLLILCYNLQAQDWKYGFRKWIDKDHYLEHRLNDKTKEGENLKVHAKTGKSEAYKEVSLFSEMRDAVPTGFTLPWYAPHTENYEQVILEKDNNLYLYTKKDKQVRQLTANPATEQNPTFSPDGQQIAFTRTGNLYSLNLATGLESILTTDGSEVVYNGWASWVYYEEILGRSSRYKAFYWSPDSKKIAYLRFDDTPVPVFPIYRANGVHGELEKMHYPKVGDPNPLVKLGICNLEDNNKTTWVDIDENIDQYIAWPFWTKDSKSLLFQQMPRDQNKIELFLANPADGSTQKVYEESRPTWVEFFEDIYMMEDNSGFILRSYKNDWRNLYYYDFEGKLKAQITDVKWRVTDISQVLEKDKKVFFKGTGATNTDTHLFSVNLDGSNLKQLTKGTGSHSTNISPDGTYFIDNHSNVSQAPIVACFDHSGKELRNIKKTAMPEFDVKKHHKVELFRVKSSDEKFDLPVVWTLPANFDKSKKYPVVFSIYGGPNAGGVRDSWRGWDGNSMTNIDIIVVSVAHRGSGKFGKAGLDYLHQNLGKWEMEDYFAVVNWLRDQPFVDPTRIGITGGSYGGYMSALALTHGADYFTHGIAALSVMDWQLYDNVYTERYMDTPTQNPKGYKFGSVMTHIPRYKGKLLVTHGLMDDNVHVQNSIQFIDKMQDAEKEFEMMFYPNERHGWGGAKGRHNRKLHLDFWKRHFFQ